MPKPTARYPRLLAKDAAVMRQAVRRVAEAIGGFRFLGVDRVDGRVNVYRLDGERGQALLGESSSRLPEPGVYQHRSSVWCRPDDGLEILVEVQQHSWDAWTEANETGDRSLIEGPRARMYAERDRRTAELAERLDRLHISPVPAGATPGFISGLPPDEVRRLTDKHRVEPARGAVAISH